MAGRGTQTFQKRQKEQQRKEKQQEKFAKRLERKTNPQQEQADDQLEPFVVDPSLDRYSPTRDA